MNTPERIEKLLLDSGIPERQIRGELARVCGISVQAVGDWFKGSTRRISPEYLAMIAEEWGTTTDYLITGRQSNNFSIDEKKLVSEFKDLSPENKEAVLKHIRGLSLTQKEH